MRKEERVREEKKKEKKKKKITDIDITDVTIVCSHHYHSKMPSFKERFRPSRKYKKNKEAGGNSIDESAIAATGTSTTGTSTTIDDQTGSAALSTYHSHCSVDYCKLYIYLTKNNFRLIFYANRHRIL